MEKWKGRERGASILGVHMKENTPALGTKITTNEKLSLILFSTGNRGSEYPKNFWTLTNLMPFHPPGPSRSAPSTAPGD